MLPKRIVIENTDPRFGAGLYEARIWWKGYTDPGAATTVEACPLAACLQKVAAEVAESERRDAKYGGSVPAPDAG